MGNAHKDDWELRISDFGLNGSGTSRQVYLPEAGRQGAKNAKNGGRLGYSKQRTATDLNAETAEGTERTRRTARIGGKANGNGNGL